VRLEKPAATDRGAARHDDFSTYRAPGRGTLGAGRLQASSQRCARQPFSMATIVNKKPHAGEEKPAWGCRALLLGRRQCAGSGVIPPRRRGSGNRQKWGSSRTHSGCFSLSLSRSLKTVLRCSPSADASGEFRPSARRGAGRVERPEAAARARRFATDGRLLRARGEADSARLRARDAGAGNGLTRGAPADLRQRTTGLQPTSAQALPEAPGIPHLSQFTAALAEETG